MADHLADRAKLLRHKLAHPEETAAALRRRWQDPEFRTRTRLLSATAVGGLQLLTVYGLSSLSCRWHWFGTADDGLPLKTLQTAVTLVALALVGWWLFRLYGDWRELRAGEESRAVEALAARNSFLAFISLLLLSLYGLIMGIMLPAIWVIPVCK
jgi:hypothetical protein